VTGNSAISIGPAREAEFRTALELRIDQQITDPALRMAFKAMKRELLALREEVEAMKRKGRGIHGR